MFREKERDLQHFFQNAHAFMRERERKRPGINVFCFIYLPIYICTYIYTHIYTHTHTHNIKRGRKEGTYKDFSKTPIHLCREKAHIVLQFLRDGLGKKRKEA